MDASPDALSQPSRLRLLLEHFSRIKDERGPEGVAHPLDESLLLCVRATIADCDSFDAIAAWGRAQLGFLRRFLPFDRGVPTARWLNIMMTRIDPELFAACFMDWVRDAGADYLLAVKGNQPTLQADIEAAFATAERGRIETDVDVDKGHGRIENRTVSVLREVDWLDGDRRFPGEVRFPDTRAIVKVEARTELKDRSRFDERYYIASRERSAAHLAKAIRDHWGIENPLHWTLDVTFQEDLSRVRKGHGAHNMALVRKFAINKLRNAPPRSDPPNLPQKPSRRPALPG